MWWQQLVEADGMLSLNSLYLCRFSIPSTKVSANTRIIPIHRVQSVNKMRAIAIDVARSVVCTCVCLCVWVLVTRINFCLGADSWWPKEPLLDGVEISPRKRAWLFLGLSGPLKTTGSLCCGERSKRDPGDHLIVNIGMQRKDHSTLYNCSTARQSCDAAIYQNSLTTCLLPLLMA